MLDNFDVSMEGSEANSSLSIDGGRESSKTGNLENIYVGKFDLKKNEVCVFNQLTSSKEDRVVQRFECFPVMSAAAQVNSHLLISGGFYKGTWDESFEALKSNYAYSIPNNEMKNLSSLILERAGHNIVAFSIEDVYYIGGSPSRKQGRLAITG